ncbi:desulfoferrodoxin family protein [Mycoplasmatota bacterium WC44]
MKHDIIKVKEALVEVLEGNLEGAMEVKTADATNEKHVPFVEETENGYIVKVGKEVFHPMTELHYIQFIELYVDGVLHRKYLNPNDEPVAEFKVEKGTEVYAREYCNIHGIWANK